MRNPGVWFLLGLLVAGGCTVNRPEVPDSVRGSEKMRTGHVFLVRGLLGVFSTGMDQLRDQLREQGVASATIMHTAGGATADEIIKEQEFRGSPIIIIGHSLGADEAAAICRRLGDGNVRVDLMITIDPVAAPQVPANVRRAVNYYCSDGPLGAMPIFHGTTLHQTSSGGQVVNINVSEQQQLQEPGTNHFTIDKNTKVQKDIVRRVLEICPPARQSEAIAAGARLRGVPDARTQQAADATGKQLH